MDIKEIRLLRLLRTISVLAMIAISVSLSLAQEKQLTEQDRLSFEQQLFESAIVLEYFDKVESFLKRGIMDDWPKCGAEVRSPLEFAIAAKSPETVKLILKYGADPSASCQLGLNSLMIASYNDDTAVVNVLLGSGVDINARADRGVTALMIAANEKKYEYAELFLRKGADPNLKMNNGLTALMVAVGDDKLVRLLLKNGAAIDAADETGQTAIFHAVEKGTVESVKALVDAPANLELKLKNGKSIMSIIEELSDAERKAKLKSCLRR